MPIWLFDGRAEGMLQDHGKKPEIVKKRLRYRAGLDDHIFDGVRKISIEASPI